MTNIVEFDGITTLDIPAERILNSAIEAQVEDVVVIGYDQDGQFYFATSKAAGGEVLWLLELARIRLVQVAEDYCENNG